MESWSLTVSSPLGCPPFRGYLTILWLSNAQYSFQMGCEGSSQCTRVKFALTPVCICLYVCVRVSVYMSVCPCVYLCVSVCIFVCVCVCPALSPSLLHGHVNRCFNFYGL